MKTLFTVVASLVLSCMLCQTSGAQLGGLLGTVSKVETVETQELREMLTDRQKRIDDAGIAGAEVPDSDFVVVDVRSDEEVRVSIIPGAITKAQYEKDATKYRDKLVIPYCTVGGRSGAYANELSSKGVKVKNYKGSILKWIDAGLPLVTLDGQPTNRVHTYSDRYRIPAKYEQVTH